MLLEFWTDDQPDRVNRVLDSVSALGLVPVIAHPERYRAIQKDMSLARRLLDIGCRLQASADFIAGGRLGREKKPAQALFDQELVSYIASDAHCVEHYEYLARARKEYKALGAHAAI